MRLKHSTQLWFIAFSVIAILALTAAPSYTATVYDDAVSYWTMDDNASNTTVIDCKNTNPGTFIDPTNPNTSAHHVTGKIGGAMSFDGVNDYILGNVNGTLSGATAVSIFCLD